jgi:MFS family permease
MGLWMDQVTRGWLMYELTGSTVELGLVQGIRVIPLLVLSPVAGTMADRYGRKRQLISSQVVHAAMNAILGGLVITGNVHPWHIYATGLIVAIVGVFELPARQSMLSDAVDKGHLANAIGLNSIAFNASRSVGPALAGALIALYGTGGSYVVQAAVYCLCTVWTVQLRVRDKAPVAEGAEARSFAGSTFDGWRYVFSHQTIRTALAVLMIAAFFAMPFSTLLPVFARDILQTGPTGQGFLLTAMGVGGVSGSFLIASIGDRVPKGPAIIAGAISYGLAVMALGHSTWFPVSLALMLVIGVANVGAATLVQTIVQSAAAATMRGRVMGMFQQVQVAITAGAVLVGALAAVVGAQNALALTGAMCVAGTAVMLVAVPHLRRMR